MREVLLHLFFPHHTNNHRAKVLHVDSLGIIAVLYLFFYLITGWISRSYPEVLGYATDIRVDQLLSLTNQKRQEQGMDSLTLNEKLSQAAAGKAQDMFAKNYWAHTGPDGKVPWDFIVGAGYSYSVAGENLAKNFNDSAGVMSAWMNSQSHRDNILKSQYTQIGFAVVNGVLNGEETTLVVQMFASPKTVSVVREVQAQAPISVEEPVEVTREASSTSIALVRDGTDVLNKSTYFAAFRSPVIDKTSLMKTVSYMLIGFFLGILAFDAWIVWRKNIVRAVGHTIGHLVFFAMFAYFVSTIAKGTIL